MFFHSNLELVSGFILSILYILLIGCCFLLYWAKDFLNER